MDEVRVDASPAAISFATTEHFNLQTARNGTIAEAVSRASLFLATVSGALVALAFIGQASRAGTPFFVFGLVLFPALVFFGLATFDRVLQVSIEDIAYGQRINRLRQFYLEVAPELTPYFAPTAASHDRVSIIRASGMRPGKWQQMLTVASTIGVVNSVVMGVVAAIAVGFVARNQIWLAAIAGAVAFIAGVIAHQQYDLRRRRSAPPVFERAGL